MMSTAFSVRTLVWRNSGDLLALYLRCRSCRGGRWPSPDLAFPILQVPATRFQLNFAQFVSTDCLPVAKRPALSYFVGRDLSGCLFDCVASVVWKFDRVYSMISLLFYFTA